MNSQFLPNKLIFTVSQPKALEICDVFFREEKVDKVVLNAGKLHGVVDGQYDVYKSDVTGDEVNSNATSDSKIGQIEVMEENIHAIKSFAKVLDKDVEGKIKVCSVRFEGRLNLPLLYTPCKIKVYGSAVRCVIINWQKSPLSVRKWTHSLFSKKSLWNHLFGKVFLRISSF